MKNVYRKKVAVVSNANQKKRRENNNLSYLADARVWNLLVLPALFCFFLSVFCFFLLLLFLFYRLWLVYFRIKFSFKFNLQNPRLKVIYFFSFFFPQI